MSEFEKDIIARAKKSAVKNKMAIVDFGPNHANSFIYVASMLESNGAKDKYLIGRLRSIGNLVVELDNYILSKTETKI